MKLLAQCPSCKSVIELSISDADKRKRCPRCGRMFKVPEPDKLQAALSVLKTAAIDVYVDEQGNVYG